MPRRSGGHPEPGCLDGGTGYRQDAGGAAACPVSAAAGRGATPGTPLASVLWLGVGNRGVAVFARRLPGAHRVRGSPRDGPPRGIAVPEAMPPRAGAGHPRLVHAPGGQVAARVPGRPGPAEHVKACTTADVITELTLQPLR